MTGDPGLDIAIPVRDAYVTDLMVSVPSYIKPTPVSDFGLLDQLTRYGKGFGGV